MIPHILYTLYLVRRSINIYLDLWFFFYYFRDTLCTIETVTIDYRQLNNQELHKIFFINSFIHRTVTNNCQHFIMFDQQHIEYLKGLNKYMQCCLYIWSNRLNGWQLLGTLSAKRSNENI